MVPGGFDTMYATVPGISKDLQRRKQKGATIQLWEDPVVTIIKNVDKTILRPDRLDKCLTQDLREEMWFPVLCGST